MPVKNVLIADDDTLFCWALQKELTQRSLNAFIANTGTECIDALSRHPFDLLFLDIHFPDANGLELLGTIRAASPGTRIVVVSGDGSARNKESALAAGVEQFLEKPFDLEVLVRFVEGLSREEPSLRKHSRYLCNFPLKIAVLAPSPDEEQYHLGNIRGTAENVGREGIRLTTHYPLRTGQGVRLRIDGEIDPFSGLVPSGGCAEVVWTMPCESIFTAGLRFLPGN